MFQWREVRAQACLFFLSLLASQHLWFMSDRIYCSIPVRIVWQLCIWRDFWLGIQLPSKLSGGKLTWLTLVDDQIPSMRKSVCRTMVDLMYHELTTVLCEILCNFAICHCTFNLCTLYFGIVFSYCIFIFCNICFFRNWHNRFFRGT